MWLGTLWLTGFLLLRLMQTWSNKTKNWHQIFCLILYVLYKNCSQIQWIYHSWVMLQKRRCKKIINLKNPVKFIYSEKATKFCNISIISLAVHRTNNWWRFRKNVWPSEPSMRNRFTKCASQNIWTLTIPNISWTKFDNSVHSAIQKQRTFCLLSSGTSFVND